MQDQSTHLFPVGCVQFYIKHSVKVEQNGAQTTETFYLGYVQWYKQHPEKDIIISIHQIHYTWTRIM